MLSFDMDSPLIFLLVIHLLLLDNQTDECTENQCLGPQVLACELDAVFLVGIHFIHM